MNNKKKDRVCSQCGCTDKAACPGGCSWVASDLCSKCAKQMGMPLTNKKGD